VAAAADPGERDLDVDCLDSFEELLERDSTAS
jgi:hypothetical protein